MFHKVKSVTPKENFILDVCFESGEKKYYDIKQLFDKIKDFKVLLYITGLFEQVKVAEGGYGIIWNDDLDLSCNEIWNNGKSINEK